MEAVLALVVLAATPLLLAAIGELVAERAGVLNLGVEGMLLLGAVGAFSAAFSTGSTMVGLAAGIGAGMAGAALFGMVALGLAANQTATGLALTILGLGVSGLLGEGFVGRTVTPPRGLIGDVDAIVIAAFLLAVITHLVLTRTRLGLRIRAVGENPDAAEALGLRVGAIRWGAVLFGGACAGLGGAYLSLAYTPMWGENMSAGRGWIAVALVVFASWRPLRAMLGALIFAAFGLADFYRETLGITISSQFVAMAPYLATILALVLISLASRRSDAPAALGRSWRPER